MGVVYRAWDLELEDEIALKVLATTTGDAAAAVAQFKHEVKIARRISHSNVARLYDLFSWRGHLAISQQLISGRHLGSILGAGGLPLSTLYRYVEDVCSALASAHAAGVVHRDLKPSNVQIDRSDRAFILDFGLATMVSTLARQHSGPIYGTPAFMAPEALLSPGSVDHRSDIYSLGVMLFCMTTGTLPFRGETTSKLIHAQVNETPPRPHFLRSEVPIELSDVILHCLEKDPASRYQSVEDLLEHVHRVATSSRHGGSACTALASGTDRLSPTVLLAADAATGARLSDELSRFPVSVIHETDGVRAIQAAIDVRPFLVLLTLELTSVAGQEVLRILSTNSMTSAIPVVMLVAAGDREEGLLARETGAATCIEGSLSAAMLELLLGRYLVPNEDRSKA